MYSGEIVPADKNVEIYSDMGISEKNEPKYSGEVETHETLDVPEETITSEDLYNKSTHQLETHNILQSQSTKRKAWRENFHQSLKVIQTS